MQEELETEGYVDLQAPVPVFQLAAKCKFLQPRTTRASEPFLLLC